MKVKVLMKDGSTQQEKEILMRDLENRYFEWFEVDPVSGESFRRSAVYFATDDDGTKLFLER